MVRLSLMGGLGGGRFGGEDGELGLVLLLELSEELVFW